MPLRVYLDTTVFSAVEDLRAPDRQIQTVRFFERASEFMLVTSELTRSEIERTPDPERRRKLIERLSGIPSLSITMEMGELADGYVKEGIIPEPYHDDAVHVAAAVLSGQEVLTSWNFRHLVNRRRRSLIN